MPANVKRSNTLQGCLFVIAVCIAISAVVYAFRSEIKNFINPVEDNIVQFEDSAYQEPVPTIQEILEFRSDMRECQRIDSVFLTMPDVILIDILVAHGTSLSNGDIVRIYESNKQTYKSVFNGAKAQQYKDSLLKIPIEDTTKISVKGTTLPQEYHVISVCEDRYNSSGDDKPVGRK